MSGDYSRKPFDSLRDFNGALLQQGRALTDWDWNDQVLEQNRRQQAGTFDTFGGVAVVPVTTPAGFELLLDDGILKIGPGRIYVDGLLAENHGTGEVRWDPALAEPVGEDPMPYEEQPYLPEPPALPATAGPHVVYVDVWQREVTHLEAPDLIERALGVDTTTRLQNVWQVKVLENEEGSPIDCDTEDEAILGWKELTAPSGGRLTNGTAAYGDDDPCLIAPSGGYTGLENQLYRVEIHDGGGLGAAVGSGLGGATFKWSRDNASVETRISSFIGNPAKTIVVDTVKKDDVLRFSDGDWVEIIDDRLELAGKPGLLRRIVVGNGVDDALRTITFEKDVDPSLFAVDGDGKPPASLHARIRRWDQKGKVLRTDVSPPIEYADLGAADSSGAIAVPSDGKIRIALESGIVVGFDLAPEGGVFRSGDYWNFAARTSGPWLEPLLQARPHGIHHHYARIGLYKGSSAEPQSCRHFWPPKSGGDSCACTICVSPVEQRENPQAIQEAIKKVIDAGGGTVCLEIGEYPLIQPLSIDGAKSVRLRGQGPQTILLADIVTRRARILAAAGNLPGIQISGSEGVVLESFSVHLGQNIGFAIAVENSRDVLVQRLSLNGSRERSKQGAVRLSGSLSDLVLRDNFVDLPSGIVAGQLRGAAVKLDRIEIAGNRLECAVTAIDLEAVALEGSTLRIAHNFVQGGDNVGIAVIAAASTRANVEIVGNHLVVRGGGIRASSRGLRIVENQIDGATELKPTVGIDVLQPPHDNDIGDCQIVANRISGFAGGGIVLEARMRCCLVKLNQIASCGGGIQMSDGAFAEALAIENNQILDIAMPPDMASPTRVSGIGATAVRTLTVLGNVISRVGRTATNRNFTTAGAIASRCSSVRMLGNEISEIGPAEPFEGIAVGISVDEFDDVDIADNRVRRDATEEKPDASAWYGVMVLPAAPSPARRSAPNIAAQPPRTAFLSALVSRLQVPTRIRAALVMHGASHRASLRGNQISARGSGGSALVEVDGSCNFSDNQCLTIAVANSRSRQANVELRGDSLIVSSNRATDDLDAVSIALLLPHTDGAPFTVLGNITSGEITVADASGGIHTLGVPWKDLNRRWP